MKKTFTSTLSAFALSAMAFAPAFADDGGMLKSTAMLPVRAVALCAGCAIGTPVAALRMGMKDTKTFADDIGGDNKAKKMLGLVIAVPAGFAKGTIQGCYMGPHNAIKNCVEHPFSKDSMSLGDLE